MYELALIKMESPAWRLAVEVEFRGAAGAAWIWTREPPTVVPSASTRAPQESLDDWRVSATEVRLAESRGGGEIKRKL